MQAHWPSSINGARSYAAGLGSVASERHLFGILVMAFGVVHLAAVTGRFAAAVFFLELTFGVARTGGLLGTGTALAVFGVLVVALGIVVVGIHSILLFDLSK